ncbi:autotransporter domain-containing protein [Rhodobacter sp. HX-7-19]|uniref:Autotransporter domain-containing protein n=1 Tax=Paragemmobacter kunshanensis TaxID=2583234 RepID=A0A6M1U593_9RHOB|nr:autotransporter domain-containing protein [Rhodobacter kunshanensis]NGQ92904.1 autotransporter domain-containing protein [Rhodobacter kunshanensis]
MSIPFTAARSRRILGLLLATTLACSGAKADPVANMFVFGDSNADVGSQGPQRRPTNAGSMWSETVARALNLQNRHAREFRINATADGIDILATGGENYAVNGGTALTFDCCVSFGQQVDFFAADRGRFASNDLVFTWFTRNDITTALPDGLPYSAQSYTDAYITQIERLRGLGARNIVAFGAEVGLIPEQFALDIGTPPEMIALLRQETLLAEAALWPRLAQNDVFIIDMNRLGDDIIADPGRYGFTATTDGYQQMGNPNPPESQTLPNDGNVFTLDGHYTSAMQDVIADYTLAQLRAGDQIGSLLLQSSDSYRQASQSLSAARSANRGEGWQIYGAPFGGLSSHARGNAISPEADLTFNGATFGVGYTFQNGTAIDAGLSMFRGATTFGGASGSAKSRSTLFEISLLHPLSEGLALTAHGSAGRTTFDRIERKARLGALAEARGLGSADGAYYSAGLGMEAARTLGNWSVRASAGVSYEKMSIDGYAEAPGVLALHFGDAESAGFTGNLDAEVIYGAETEVFRPFSTLSLNHDFSGRDMTVKAGPTADTIVSRPVGGAGGTTASLELGVKVKLGASVSGSASVYGSLQPGSDRGLSASGLRLALVSRF